MNIHQNSEETHMWKKLQVIAALVEFIYRGYFGRLEA